MTRQSETITNSKVELIPEKKNKSELPKSQQIHTKRDRDIAGQLFPIIVMVIMFIISIGFALFLAPIYVSLNFQADFSELGGEESLIIPFFYLAIILIFTAIILFITRKRRGRFIKYGFLAVICLSMIYVFSAIFTVLFFPLPDQSWSDEVKLEGGVSAILITDLVIDSELEVIVGTNSGNIHIYDNDLNLLWNITTPSNVPIDDLAVADLNNDSRLELIVLSDYILIFEYSIVTSSFDLAWFEIDYHYSSMTIIPNYPVEVSNILRNRPVILGTIKSYSQDGYKTEFRVIGNQDQYGQIGPLVSVPVSVNAMEYARFNNTTKLELYLCTDDGIYSISELKPFPENITLDPVITGLGRIQDIIINDIDLKGSPELTAWNDEGHIFVYSPNKDEPRWEKKVGKRIGGVALGDVFETYKKYYKGSELVVSADGRVRIYYSYDGFLDENFEFTEETGRLDKLATGLAVGYLDNNDELDIVVGFEKGFKHYQYQTYYLSDTPCFIGLFVSIILTIFLFYHPEWYLVDIVGIVVAGGVTALLGISIGLLPIILLLVVLAIYDAISVYKTKHMVSLADKVMEFKLPILLVVPKKRGYSFLRQKGLKKQLEDGEEREAMFIGLGDIIIPGALVISAFHFLPATESWFGITGNMLVAIFTLVGILVGFSVLMQYVLKGNPQAGLPLLNTGAILGFLFSAILIFQSDIVNLIFPFG